MSADDSEPISRRFDPNGANCKTSTESDVRREDMRALIPWREDQQTGAVAVGQGFRFEIPLKHRKSPFTPQEWAELCRQ